MVGMIDSVGPHAAASCYWLPECRIPPTAVGG